MRKEFSPAWKTSNQPRKQRKFRYNAPMHLRQKMVSAHLDKILRKEYKKRSIVIRKDDEVKILRGGFAGRSGKVTRVDLKKLKIYVDSAKVKKVSGQDAEVALDPSNVVITKLNLDDKKRKKFLIRKQPKEAAAKPKEPSKQKEAAKK